MHIHRYYAKKVYDFEREMHIEICDMRYAAVRKVIIGCFPKIKITFPANYKSDVFSLTANADCGFWLPLIRII